MTHTHTHTHIYIYIYIYIFLDRKNDKMGLKAISKSCMGKDIKTHYYQICSIKLSLPKFTNPEQPRISGLSTFS